VQKTSYLARILQSFFEVGAKLDEHLVPTGAFLHATISLTCQGEIHMDAPHHRRIRIHGLLGFFADQDDHVSRIINIGLSFAYLQKELDAFSTASALLLEQLRLSSVRHSNPVGSPRLWPRPDPVPDGGQVVRNDRAAACVESESAPGTGVSIFVGASVCPFPRRISSPLTLGSHRTPRRSLFPWKASEIAQFLDLTRALTARSRRCSRHRAYTLESAD